MKNLKLATIAIAAIFLPFIITIAHAATSVQNVKLQQRYPWNGLVDIDYEIVSDGPAETDFFVYLIIKDNDMNATIAPRAITGEGVPGIPVKKGVHRVTWNMGSDIPGFHSSSLSAYVHASTAMPYMVVDVTAGPSATTYPVRYSATPPNLSDDTCRTTEVWLKFIQPGTFMMGSPSDEANRDGNNETLHQVTLTKPYYIGVFEITQKQWTLVMGSNPASSKGDTRPVECVSYNTIRGTVSGAAWPVNGQVDSSSFLGKLRTKTSVAIDLPTEAQWEYACRAGTSSAFNNGKGVPYDTNLAQFGRFTGNQSDGKGGYTSGHTKVGSYQANAWGLYDMHGNAMEWCLDWQATYGAANLTDPSGPTAGSHRILRGGSYLYSAVTCRSASRMYTDPYRVETYYSGLRVVALPAIR